MRKKYLVTSVKADKSLFCSGFFILRLNAFLHCTLWYYIFSLNISSPFVFIFYSSLFYLSIVVVMDNASLLIFSKRKYVRLKI